jgi:hypothetical protein
VRIKVYDFLRRTYRLLASKLAVVLGSFVLVSCGGGTDIAASGDGGVGSGGTGIVFTGAPVADSKVTAIDDNGVVVASDTTDRDGVFAVRLPRGGTYLLRAALPNGRTLHNFIQFDGRTQTVRSNISPVSELFTAVTLKSDPALSPRGKLSSLSEKIPEGIRTVTQLLAPFLDAQEALIGISAGDIVPGILSSNFATNNQGLDGVVDRISIEKYTDSYVIGFPSASAIPWISMKVDASDLDNALTTVQSDTYQLAVAATVSQLQQVPAVLVLDGLNSWATDGRHMALWIPKAQSSAWSLSFETETLSANLGFEWAGGQLGSIFYDTQYMSDGSAVTRYVLQGLPNTAYPDGSVVTWGLLGANFPNAAVDLRNCTFNGVACAIRGIKADNPERTFLNLLSGYGHANAQALAQRVSSALNGVNASSPLTPRLLGSSVQAQASQLQLVWEVEATWSGGYGGLLSVVNTSQDVLTGSDWVQELQIALPAGIFAGGPWNMQASRDPSTGFYTFRPLSTQADLEPGARAASGYTGSEVSLLCPLRSGVANQVSLRVGPRLAGLLDAVCLGQ